MKVGIIFGGFSREREISFAGGRTVYDNLDRSIFEPVPIFLDSFGNFILLDWKYLYKGTIRDFYPDPELSFRLSPEFQIYADSVPLKEGQSADELASHLGQKLELHELANEINFAFLALHGKFGEDGTIQGLLESIGIPYSGSGVLASAIGIDKAYQKKMMQNTDFDHLPFIEIGKDWIEQKEEVYNAVKEQIGFPAVSRPATQGSSIGVQFIHEEDFDQFVNHIEESFFIKTIHAANWLTLNDTGQIQFVADLCDIRTGVGLPMFVDGSLIEHPKEIFKVLHQKFSDGNTSVKVEAVDSENKVIIEPFIKGKEFSCIVLRHNNGEPIALPPTEIIKGEEIFDYRSKYLAGLSRKKTPIDLPDEAVQKIRAQCCSLFEFFNFNVYARIDGFYTPEGKIFLNDPNTTSGMLPSSFFFHQASEIGLTPSEFLSFIIRQSLFERKESNKYPKQELQQALDLLDKRLQNKRQQIERKITIGVILGGYSAERHISVESGRNIFEKLSSSEKYTAIPYFLKLEEDGIHLYKIPVNILLKDNADDITEKINSYRSIPILEEIKKDAEEVSQTFASKVLSAPVDTDFNTLKEEVDAVFIALHGRPGEDGSIQSVLEEYNIPYNGSSPNTSKTTINKYRCNQMLLDYDFKVPEQLLIFKDNWFENKETSTKVILNNYSFPFVVKPVDDGCSAAVKMINNEEELVAFADLIFRDEEKLSEKECLILNLKSNEEFPRKNEFLVENKIEKGNASRFLEVTVGLLTSDFGGGSIFIEVFEPSEVLSSSEILSLEEKFLAGEGQNITPARFHNDPELNETVSMQVRAEIKRVAETLNIEGYARIDAFVHVHADGKTDVTILEVNSLPGMTPATCIFHQSALNGYKPFEFIDKILDYGFKKFTIEPA